MIRYILGQSVLEANGWVIPDDVKVISWIVFGVCLIFGIIAGIANSR